MIEIGRREIGINNFAIRLVAIIAMIISACGKFYSYDYPWMTPVGWTSFTLFAFLLVEGVAHSSNKRLYFRRLLLFTAISEVAYDYMRFHTFWNLRYSSVMVTLFASYLLLCLLVHIKKRYQNIVLDMILIVVLGYGLYILSNMYNFEYGGYGIIIILMFYVAREVTYTKITEIIVLFYVCFFLTSNVYTHITILGIQYPIAPELFSALALPCIWLYDDNRGPNSIALQVLQYLAYPLTLGVIIFVKYFYNS